MALTSATAEQYTLLVGPRFRFGNVQHTLDVRALVGGSNLNVRVPVSVSTFTSEDFGFAAAVGASYTVRLNEVFSFRVIQPDVLLATAGETRVNFRLSTGIVFHYD